MKAFRLLKERNRLCRTVGQCAPCPLYDKETDRPICDSRYDFDIHTIIDSVEKWSRENPEGENEN